MVTLFLIFNEINKNDSQRQMKIKPEFIKIESNASVIKLNSVRHLEMMINGSQLILEKGENFSNENNSVKTQFLSFAKSQSVQRKGRNLNNITIQQESSKYDSSQSAPSKMARYEPSVPSPSFIAMPPGGHYSLGQQSRNEFKAVSEFKNVGFAIFCVC